jgi:phenylalanyl-tRNA synthetase beta subunit
MKLLICSEFELTKIWTKNSLRLQDSIIEGAVRMRPSLLSGLLDAVRTNFNHQRRDVKLFEIGKVFAASKKRKRFADRARAFGALR